MSAIKTADLVYSVRSYKYNCFWFPNLPHWIRLKAPCCEQQGKDCAKAWRPLSQKADIHGGYCNTTENFNCNCILKQAKSNTTLSSIRPVSMKLYHTTIHRTSKSLVEKLYDILKNPGIYFIINFCKYLEKLHYKYLQYLHSLEAWISLISSGGFTSKSLRCFQKSHLLA